MDIKEVPVDNLLGNSIGFFAPMNGGKTEAMVQELKRGWYYGYNYIGYNHQRNTRETDALVVNDEERFPAKTVGDISELRDDLELRIASLDSAGGNTGESYEIAGIPHTHGYPLKVIGIDEVNLFCLSEQEADGMLDFMRWAREEGLVLYMAGLLYDFRHRAFGQVHALLPYIDIKQEKKPACMALRGDKTKCTNTAKHSQRVWSRQLLAEQGLSHHYSSEMDFNFIDKDHVRYDGEYVPAPFFDRTVRIQETKDGKIKYVPACSSCAQLPFKDEVFEIYQGIVRGDATFGILGDSVLTQAIVDFLSDEIEGWVTKNEAGVYVPCAFYRNRVGGYSSTTL